MAVTLTEAYEQLMLLSQRLSAENQELRERLEHAETGLRETACCIRAVDWDNLSPETRETITRLVAAGGVST